MDNPDVGPKKVQKAVFHARRLCTPHHITSSFLLHPFILSSWRSILQSCAPSLSTEAKRAFTIANILALHLSAQSQDGCHTPHDLNHHRLRLISLSQPLPRPGVDLHPSLESFLLPPSHTQLPPLLHSWALLRFRCAKRCWTHLILPL